MLNLRRFYLHSAILALLVLGLFFIALPAASAYPYPGPLVECENYVFVPRQPDGSWTCPPPSLNFILDLLYRFFSIFRS